MQTIIIFHISLKPFFYLRIVVVDIFMYFSIYQSLIVFGYELEKVFSTLVFFENKREGKMSFRSQSSAVYKLHFTALVIVIGPFII